MGISRGKGGAAQVRSVESHNEDNGSSVVEVAVLGVGLIVSLTLTILMMGEAQRVALAVSAAARDAARSASVAPSTAAANAAALVSAREALASYGLDPSRATVVLEGRLERGSSLEVSIAYPIQIRFAGVFEASSPLRIASRSRFEVGPHSPVPR